MGKLSGIRVVDLSQFHGHAPVIAAGRARLLLVGAKQGVNCALLVSSSLGLRSQDDFEPDTEVDARPWVKNRLRDAQNNLWLQLDAGKLLTSSDFLDAGLA